MLELGLFETFCMCRRPQDTHTQHTHTHTITHTHTHTHSNFLETYY